MCLYLMGSLRLPWRKIDFMEGFYVGFAKLIRAKFIQAWKEIFGGLLAADFLQTQINNELLFPDRLRSRTQALFCSIQKSISLACTFSQRTKVRSRHFSISPMFTHKLTNSSVSPKYVQTNKMKITFATAEHPIINHIIFT